MDERFDFEWEPTKPAGHRPSIWDVLTVLILLVTLAIAIFFCYLLINPTTPLNPLQFHLPALFSFPTTTFISVEPSSMAFHLLAPAPTATP